jgi:hypothetical protein
VTPVRLTRGGSTLLYQLLFVQVDPLRLFDGARTFEAFTGRDYLVIESGDRYRLEAA